jgi:hypothetical protein
LAGILKDLYDPSSPEYRHFLSVKDFTDRFAPTADQYDAVVEFARARGFEVKNLPANRLIVPINGTVQQVQDAFNIRLVNYQHPTEQRAFFSTDREPSVPAGLQLLERNRHAECGDILDNPRWNLSGHGGLHRDTAGNRIGSCALPGTPAPNHICSKETCREMRVLDR